MSTLNATIRFLIDGTFVKALDLTTPQERIAIAESQAFANGTGANQGNEFFTDNETLDNTQKTYDLLSGEVNAFGEALVFDKVRALFIHNKETDVNTSLAITGDAIANNTWISADASHFVGAGGWYIALNPVDGYQITATIQHKLTIITTNVEVEYDLIIVGTT